MTLSGLKTKANSKLTIIWDKISTMQASYFAKNARYWQGILTPSNLPIGGVDTDIDLTKKPYYQAENWSFLGAKKIPFQIQVDQYKTPNNTFGFQVTVFVEHNGNTYSRSKGIGDEATSRNHN